MPIVTRRILYYWKTVPEETSNSDASVSKVNFPEETENSYVSISAATFNAEEIPIIFPRFRLYI